MILLYTMPITPINNELFVYNKLIFIYRKNHKNYRFNSKSGLNLAIFLEYLFRCEPLAMG